MNKYRKTFKRIIFLLYLAGSCLAGESYSQVSYANDSVAEEDSITPLFSSNEILDISIYFDDLEKLKKDVSEINSEHKAFLIVNNADGRSAFNIKVKTRGIFRKNPSNCSFPPLKLDFKKSELENSIFKDQNRLKLVTHCMSWNMDYEQYIIQEYLAYRIYNILTEKSFKVRLARINYIDDSRNSKDVKRYGFFIEDVDDMAERNGCTHVDLSNIPQDYTDYFFENLLSVYQYMIGNTDWSVPGMHNIKLILEKPDTRPIPVPYDFDFSGIVDPVYAVPHAKFDIESVDDRLFRGYERPVKDLQRVFDYITSKKSEIYSLYEESPLSQQQKDRAIEYLDEFFFIISDEALVRLEFIVNGRKYNTDDDP